MSASGDATSKASRAGGGSAGSRLGAIKSGEQQIWAAQHGISAPGAVVEGQAIAGSLSKVDTSKDIR